MKMTTMILTSHLNQSIQDPKFFLIANEIFIKFWFLHISNFLTTTENEVRHEGIIDVVLDK